MERLPNRTRVNHSAEIVSKLSLHMSTARAIQVSVTHLSLGVIGGATIDALMPAYSASSSDAMLVFEAFVQVALSGVLLSQVGSQLNDDDPTFGLPFSLGLWRGQPGLLQRIDAVTSIVKQRVSQVSQKMAPLVEAEA